MRAAYRIQDEPKPSSLADWTVNPFWPLLGLMLGGAWLGFPWFVFNGFAMGSATRVREAVYVAVAFVGSGVLAAGLLLVFELGILERDWIRYAMLVMIVWKLAWGYWLFHLQSTSFALYEWIDGRSRNGVLVLVAAFFARGWVLDAVGLTLFQLMLS